MNPRATRTLRWVGGAVFCAGVVFGGSLVAATADRLSPWACALIFIVAAVLVVTWDLWEIVLTDDPRPNVADLICCPGRDQQGGRPSGEVFGPLVNPRPRLMPRYRPPLFDAVADDPRLADQFGEMA